METGIIKYITECEITWGFGKLDIPDAFNTVAAYPIAPVSDSKHAELAKAFVALVLSPDGQAVMAKYGFVPVQ